MQVHAFNPGTQEVETEGFLWLSVQPGLQMLSRSELQVSELFSKFFEFKAIMAGKIYQWVKVPAAKTDNLSLIPKTHTVEEENWPTSYLWPLWVHTHSFVIKIKFNLRNKEASLVVDCLPNMKKVQY